MKKFEDPCGGHVLSHFVGVSGLASPIDTSHIFFQGRFSFSEFLDEHLLV